MPRQPAGSGSRLARSIGIQDPCRIALEPVPRRAGSRLPPVEATPSEESHSDASESTAEVSCARERGRDLPARGHRLRRSLGVFGQSPRVSVWVIAAMAFTSLAGLVFGSSQRWFRSDQPG